jgi:hypothetical protein
MWRVLSILVALLALTVLSVSHRPLAAQPAADKQLICHVSDDNGAHIIEVSVHAVPAHLRNHGDCLINSTDRDLIGEECDPTDANDNDICDIQP